MNIFQEFELLKEVVIKEGEITLDQQRVLTLPVSFIANYTLARSKEPAQTRELYNSMKNGMSAFSIPLGKTYGLTYRDFLERWIKYNAFGGWGIVEYKLIEINGATYGSLSYRNLTTHLYLKSKGIKNVDDPLLEGIIAGALSSTFKVDVDVIETKCVCAGNDECTFNWGSKEYLQKEFPELTAKIKGEKS